MGLQNALSETGVCGVQRAREAALGTSVGSKEASISCVFFAALSEQKNALRLIGYIRNRLAIISLLNQSDAKPHNLGLYTLTYPGKETTSCFNEWSYLL
jgi:hypothetical protein